MRKSKNQTRLSTERKTKSHGKKFISGLASLPPEEVAYHWSKIIRHP